MSQEASLIITEVTEALAKITRLDDLAQLKVSFLGKKSPLKQTMNKLGSLPPEERRIEGQKLHELQTTIEALFADKASRLEEAEQAARWQKEKLDFTFPGRHVEAGHYHPLEMTSRKLLAILQQLGFWIEEGPEIESTHYNFDALNFPPDHPAKEMQDTFFLESIYQDEKRQPLLLRTHTSPVQIRAMQKTKPPLRVAAPGKVYRCDADVTHSPMFHQIEGFWVDHRVTFADLKGVLTELLQGFFGNHVAVRFRPSFFPFTEPSAEVDMGCVLCNQQGCRVCSQTGWLEVLGCGMIHRNVLHACDLNPEIWQGFAFGLGVERFAMIQYGIPDIRLFYESDLRFLKQFSGLYLSP